MIIRKNISFCIVCFVVFLAVHLAPRPGQADALSECMQKTLFSSNDAVTVGEIRAQCLQQLSAADSLAQGQPRTAVEKRVREERKNILKPFTLTAHRANYILPFAFNSAGYNSSHHGVKADGDPYDFREAEVQFQLSLKTPLMVDLFDGNLDVYAAYTNHSFWQMYNSDDSRPFRETIHEPEIWVQFHPNWELFGFKNTGNLFGFNHQSNGQGNLRSRTWNRLFATFLVERGNLAISLRPWVAFYDKDADGDNPNISDYMGHYEMMLSYRAGEHTFTLREQNNLESGFSRGGLELSWSFPLGSWPFLRGYVQYYTGYGESLIDYDEYVNRIGIGFSLSDWL
jgi:phospholipase A1